MPSYQLISGILRPNQLITPLAAQSSPQHSGRDNWCTTEYSGGFAPGAILTSLYCGVSVLTWTWG
eukprot:15325002-Ditylum_brightwellii.AAC.1